MIAERDQDALRAEHLWTDAELERAVAGVMARPASRRLVAEIERAGYSHEESTRRVRFQAEWLIRSKWVRERGEALLNDNKNDPGGSR